MKLPPSITTPLLIAVTVAGPIIGGNKLFNLILNGDALGTIWIVLPPGCALFCTIAQRRVFAEPSSAVLLTTNVSACAIVAPPKSNTPNANGFVFMITFLSSCLALKLEFQIICGAVQTDANCALSEALSIGEKRDLGCV